ncbi:hypothetical protein A7981_11480 [Methylovorus sp. MM2]|uniref:hypothetical protein n=1 Tax=Methylovorus sp. MM2 TaxID=1848038 RepID=UPI0007E03FD9|nr:hypothetical protein [Methylovorus sp. MM2]OAM51338.1 hypothetical protein A7981_11480 [Methylovorus sp. MM2]
MSLRWFKFLRLNPAVRDELRIFIQPHQLVLSRIKRRLTKEVVVKQIIPVNSTLTDSNAGSKIVGNQYSYDDIWQPAIYTLRQTLHNTQWQNTDAHIALSSHFCRYAVIPWNENLANAAERQAYLHHCFAIAYGEPAKLWDIRLNPGGYGQTSLASGISTALLGAVQAAFQDAHMSIKYIYPHLMIAMNELRQDISRKAANDSFWIVTLEQGRLCLGLIENNQWRSLKSHATEDDLSVQLEALIQRETIMTGIDAIHWPILAYWVESGEFDTISSLPGRKISTVPLHHSQADRKPIPSILRWV